MLGLGRLPRSPSSNGTPKTLVASFTGASFANDWGPGNLTVTASAYDGPSGMLNTTKVQETAVDGFHSLDSVGFAVTQDLVYTAEVIVAGDGVAALYIAAFDGVTHAAIVNLTTGVCTVPFGGATASARLLDNGYWKVSVVFPASATTTANFTLYTCLADGTLSYLGNITHRIKLSSVIVTR